MLFDDVHRFGWPVDKCCLAVDEAAIHGTEIAAVARDRAMVAHHVVAMRRQHDRRYRSHVAKTLRHIRFRDSIAVHVDASLVDLQTVAGQRDDALDVALRRIAWIVENDDIAAADVFKVIDEFVDKDAVLIMQARQHAGAFDTHRLVEKGDDEECHSERDENVARPNDHGAAALAARRYVERMRSQRMVFLILHQLQPRLPEGQTMCAGFVSGWGCPPLGMYCGLPRTSLMPSSCAACNSSGRCITISRLVPSGMTTSSPRVSSV